MLVWVMAAGSERLKHLGLMRASRASRRFAVVNLLLLSVGLGLFAGTQRGWQWVPRAALNANPAEAATSLNGAWIRVADARNAAPLQRGDEVPVVLLWSYPRTLAAVFSGMATGLVVSMALLWSVRAVLARVWHRRRPQGRRMSAALHYGTGWSLFLALAGIMTMLLPGSYVAAIERWQWFPPQSAVELAAGTVAAVGAVLGWLWLIRMGATTPLHSRSRVVAFCIVGAPLLGTIGAACWWFMWRWLYASGLVLIGYRP